MEIRLIFKKLYLIVISIVIKICTLGVFPALAFVADFPTAAPKFHQRMHRVRLKNLGTTDKKSSHKIKYKKIPRVHWKRTEEIFYGKIYYDGYNYYTEKSVPKCSYNKFKQAQIGSSISKIKNISNDFLQKYFYAPRINFDIKHGDKGFLCTSHIYTSIKGELTQIGADSIQISFGMPIIINSIEKKWCKISSVFNFFIGYIPIADIEIMKP